MQWFLFFHLVDGLENTTSVTFELDKPYTIQRDDADEITVCSKGNNSSLHSQDKDNVLLYRTEVPIKVNILDINLIGVECIYFIQFYLT